MFAAIGATLLIAGSLTLACHLDVIAEWALRRWGT